MKSDTPFSPRGPIFLLDTMWAGAGGPPHPNLLARNAYISMIETAQNVADRYGLSREEIDAFALRSQLHAAAARDSGRLAQEIHPIEIPATRSKPAEVFEHDEFIRADTTAEKLAGLPAQPNTTQMTAGNSSPLSDGASAVVLASGRGRLASGSRPWHEWFRQPPGRSTPFSWASRPPSLSRSHSSVRLSSRPKSASGRSTRPSPLKRSGYSGSCQQLGGFEVPDERLNPNGGGVAIGHPFGSSGTRYVLTLATELHIRHLRYGVLGVCVGSGQGVALVLENPNAGP